MSDYALRGDSAMEEFMRQRAVGVEAAFLLPFSSPACLSLTQAAARGPSP